MMKKKISPEKESNKESRELENLQNENTALKEYLNLKDEVFYRQQMLLALFRIAKALEDSLKTSDGVDDMKKKKVDEDEDSDDEDDEVEDEEE